MSFNTKTSTFEALTDRNNDDFAPVVVLDDNQQCFH
jgi:hypothetical protein